MLRKIGLVVAAIGAVAALAGVVLNTVDPGPDANIGAGILVVLGLPALGVGLVLFTIGVLLRERRSR